MAEERVSRIPHSRVIWRRWHSKEDLRAGFSLTEPVPRSLHKRLRSGGRSGLLLVAAGPQSLHKTLGSISSPLEPPYSNGSPGQPHLLQLYSRDPTFRHFQTSEICPLLHLFSSFYENGFLTCQKVILSTSSSYKTRKPWLSKIRSHNLHMPMVS